MQRKCSAGRAAAGELLFSGEVEKVMAIAIKCDSFCISKNRASAIGCPVSDSRAQSVGICGFSAFFAIKKFTVSIEWLGIRDFPEFNCDNGIKTPHTNNSNPRQKGVLDMMIMDRIALILTIIGALNWGSIGLFQFDVVAWICGGSSSLLSRIIYTVVALAGIWCISLIFRARESFSHERE